VAAFAHAERWVLVNPSVQRIQDQKVVVHHQLRIGSTRFVVIERGDELPPSDLESFEPKDSPKTISPHEQRRPQVSELEKDPRQHDHSQKISKGPAVRSFDNTLLIVLGSKLHSVRPTT
jgi:hypothetical protein